MMAIAVIILAMLIALVLLVFFGAASKTNNNSQSKLSGTEIDWSVYSDEELQSYLPDKKINAIKRYRELTGVGLKESKETIEYIIANPDAKKGKRDFSADTGGAGVRDLILEGRVDEAVDVYAAFMGVDEFTARDAIENLQREMTAESNLADVNYDELRSLVSDGKKIEAIRLYMLNTGTSLSDAKHFVETEL